MYWPILLSAVAVVIVPVLLMLLFRSGRKAGKVTYQKNLGLFTPEERTLHSVLKQAVGEEFEVFGKIQVGDILRPRKGTLVGNARKAYEDIAGRHFTFVLCHRSDLRVAGVIVLDDRDPGSRKYPDQDGWLKSLCESARLPLVRFGASPFYEVGEIRAAVAGALRDEPLSLPQSDGRREPRISSIEGLDLE